MSDDTRCGRASVCSLTPEEMARRGKELRATLRPLLLDHETSANRVVWVFADTPEMRGRLDEVVAFERQCCSGLLFKVAAIAGNQTLQLTIAGKGAEIFSSAVR